MRPRFKTKVLEKFMEMVAMGTIRDFQPIPNGVFNISELNDLYVNGYIYLHQFRGGSEFRAVT